MIESVDLLFRVIFYGAKVLRLGLVLGIFEALKRAMLWVTRPASKRVTYARLQRVGR
ncbi:MAG: hypothetical protein V1921_05030 [Candidatus Altiarchaeota archaeon]